MNANNFDDIDLGQLSDIISSSESNDGVGGVHGKELAQFLDEIDLDNSPDDKNNNKNELRLSEDR